jgi:hypothetical protein
MTEAIRAKRHSVSEKVFLDWSNDDEFPGWDPRASPAHQHGLVPAPSTRSILPGSTESEAMT